MPLSETKELKEGGGLLFLGSYNEAGYPQGKGTIKVYLLNSFPPPYPDFTLKGPMTLTEELSSKWEREMPVGTYTITYEDLDDHGAPPPETKILERNGTITFDAAYGSPKAHVFTIDSKPSGAKVYLDGSLLGNAPIKAKISLDSTKHAIRCSLHGYEDYNYYDYRAQEPGSTTYSIGAKWTCAMVAQKEQPRSSATKSPTPPSLKSVSEVKLKSELMPPPQPEINEQLSSPQADTLQTPPRKPQGFFSRIWRAILSIFGK
ncbi:MAG: PEGA domain-containing protein [bacterium]|nr:PEGA domain-containing protein [bacterium]